MEEHLSYEKSGVNIDVADETKRAMASSMETADERVLNKIGAFATLFDGRFPGYQHPILVLKTEEPGSKQKLAFQHGRPASICYDMIHHLINDIIVMGARPLSVQDCIVCGKLEKEIVTELVAALSDACRKQDCVLTGGETSEQPGVVEAGTYILTSSIVGVVDKTKIIDGSRIKTGDIVLAVASNGVHTNGYSLIRALIAQDETILERPVDGKPFLDAILEPHKCYYQPLKDLLDRPEIHGLAHITGGGIQGNLNRVLPEGLDAQIGLDRLRIHPLFKFIRDAGNVPDPDMLRTFNMGVGMVIVTDPSVAESIQGHLANHDCASYPIGEIVTGNRNVVLQGELNW